VHLTRAENTATRRLSSFPCLAPVHSRTVLSSRSQFVHPANPQQRATRELAGLASQNPLPWFVRGHGVFWLAAAAWWWHSQRQGGRNGSACFKYRQRGTSKIRRAGRPQIRAVCKAPRPSDADKERASEPFMDLLLLIRAQQ
jgi:hypothetical protein